MQCLHKFLVDFYRKNISSICFPCWICSGAEHCVTNTLFYISTYIRTSLPQCLSSITSLDITWIGFQNAIDSFEFFQENSRLGALADWATSVAGLELWQEQLNNGMRWTLLSRNRDNYCLYNTLTLTDAIATNLIIIFSGYFYCIVLSGKSAKASQFFICFAK